MVKKVKKYNAKDILNYLETIDEKSFNRIYKKLDMKEREKVDEGIKEFTEESAIDGNWTPNS